MMSINKSHISWIFRKMSMLMALRLALTFFFGATATTATTTLTALAIFNHGILINSWGTRAQAPKHRGNLKKCSHWARAQLKQLIACYILQMRYLNLIKWPCDLVFIPMFCVRFSWHAINNSLTWFIMLILPKDIKFNTFSVFCFQLQQWR